MLDLIYDNTWWFLLGAVVSWVLVATFSYLMAATKSFLCGFFAILSTISSWVCWVCFLISIVMNLIAFVVEKVK